MEEKSSCGEQLCSLCCAGNLVLSEGTGTVVSILFSVPARYQPQVHTLLVILAEDPAQCAYGYSDFTSFSLYLTSYKLKMGDIKLTLICLLSKVTGRLIFWLRIYFMLNTIFY